MTILDINDHTPTFTQSSLEIAIDENTPAGTVIVAYEKDDGNEGGEDGSGELRASSSLALYSFTDFDIDQNSNVTLSLQSPTTRKGKRYFEMDAAGVVSIAFSPDYEEDASLEYNFTITATDNGDPARSASVTFAISILDLNDNVPTFDAGVYAVIVERSENVAPERLIVLNVEDSDTTPTFAVISKETYAGLNNSAIEVRRPEHGVIEVWLVRPADHSEAPSIFFSITVADNENPLFVATADVQITVAEPVPIFAKSSSGGYITTQPVLDAVDFNVYSFDSGYFIDSLSGVVSVEHQHAKVDVEIDAKAQVSFEIVHYGFLLDEMLYTNSDILGDLRPKTVKVYAQLAAQAPERVPFPEKVLFTLSAWMAGVGAPLLQVKALVDQVTGISEGEISIPVSWQDGGGGGGGFTPESVLSVAILGDDAGSDVIGAKALTIFEGPPAPSLTGSAASPSVWAIAPSEGVRVHESANVSVHAHAPHGLSSFVVRFVVSPYLRLRSFFPASDDDWLLVVADRNHCPPYTAAAALCTSTLTLSGSRRASSNPAPQPGSLTLLAKILLAFEGPADGGPVPNWESHSMSFEFTEFLPAEEPFEAGFTSGTIDRSGTKVGSSTVQIHALEQDRVLALSLSIPNLEMLNTAVLTGAPVSTELRVYSHRGDFFATSATPSTGAGVTCHGSNANVAIVADDCSSITMLGGETAGSDSFVVTAVHSETGVETSLSLRIWFPNGPAVLRSLHDVVHQISSWPTSDCSGKKMYQGTSVTATMEFTDSKVSFDADITALVGTQVRSSHPEMGSLTAAPLADDGKSTVGAPLQFVGLDGPGASTLTLTTHNGTAVSNSLTIVTGGEGTSVGVAGLLITVLAELQLLTDNIDQKDGADGGGGGGANGNANHEPTTFYARVLRGVHQIGVPYRYTAYAVCSDGRTIPVDEASGLSWSTSASYRHVRVNGTHIARKENAPLATPPGSLEIDFSFHHSCPLEDGADGAGRSSTPGRIAGGHVSARLRASEPPAVLASRLSVVLAEGVYSADDNREVVTLEAADSDTWRYDPIYYAIVGMNYTSLAPANLGGGKPVVLVQPQPLINSLFEIGSVSGTVSVVSNGELDFEQMRELTLTVAVTNSEATARLLEAGLTPAREERLPHGDSFTVSRVDIALSDINDNAPVLPDSPRVRLLPTTVPGTVIHHVGGTDADSGDNAALHYSVLSESPPGIVAVDGPSGLVVLQNELPRGLLYGEVRVRAADRGSTPFSRAANGTFILEVFDPEYLVQLDLELTPAVFGMLKNDFAAVIGAQIGVAVHLAGEQVQVDAADGDAHVRAFVVHALDKYIGLDHTTLLEEIAQVQLLTVYGGMLSKDLADLLGSIDFQNSFGTKSPAAITAFNYTTAADWSGIIRDGGSGMQGNTSTLGAAADQSKSSEIGLGVGLGAIVLLAIIGIVVGIVMQRNRQNEHDRQLRHLLEGSSAAQSGIIGGALFSFSGGEVDPMTGGQFFQDYQAKAGGSPGIANAFQGFAHPTAATAEELQSDFKNPLFDENAPVGAPNYASESRPAASFAWMPSPANPLFGLDQDGDGAVERKEVDDAALMAAGLPNRNFAPLVSETHAASITAESALVAEFQSYLASSDAY